MVTLADIEEAQRRLRGVATRTPLLRFPLKDQSRELYLKLESFQPIGSFKLRGAYNKISSLTDDERRRGVIAYSSGNHAQGVAYAARAMKTRAVIVMPNNAPRVKMDATRSLGAEIVLVGPGSNERKQRAEELARDHGYTLVPPYDDEKVIAGQGTMGLEILEDLPDVELVLSPVSGGGIISGIATAIKSKQPNIKVVGVEPELAADAQESLRTGKLATWPAEKTVRTMADGLRTSPLGTIPFEHIRKYVDDMVAVSEAEISDTIRKLLLEARVLAEPSGAVTTAAYLFRGKQLPPAGKAVAVVSGGNIDPGLLMQILAGS